MSAKPTSPIVCYCSSTISIEMGTTENKTTEKIIIEAARRVFIEKGYGEANMSDIAQRAGINRPALHYYFRTKDRMLEAVYSDIVSSFMPQVVQIFQDEDIPLLEKVGKVVDIYYDILVEKPNLPMFGLGEIYRDAHYLFNTLVKVSDNQIKVIRGILLSEMAKGRIRNLPVEFIIYSFYGLLFSPFTLHPMVKLVTDVPDPLTREYLASWKPCILAQIKALLATD